jgi:ATP-binding cassette subfamily B protein/subfamily B ATP-binding cassette protein MsbA
MNGIWRTVRMALRYRFTLVGIVVSSLLMGALWGANISVIYPFVEVVFLEKTMQEWARDERARMEKEVDELRRQAAALRSNQAPTDRVKHEKQLRNLQTKQELAERGITWMARVEPWINRFAPQSPFRTLLALVAVLLIGSLLKDICLVANMVFVERLVQLVVFDLRKQFYRQTLRQDMASFNEHSSSELLARFTNDIAALAAGLNNIVGKAIREPLRMVACFIGAAWISWQLLLFSLLIAPPCLLAMRWLAKSLKRNSRKALEEVAHLFQRLTETFSGIQTIKAFTMEPYERLRFHDATKKIYHVMLKVSMYTALTKPVTELFGVGVICLALIAGTYLALNQETHLLGIKMCDRPLSAPALMLFYGMLAGVSDPARKLSDIFGFIQAGNAAADRLFPLIDRQPRIVDPAQPQSPPRPHGRLVFDNVSFHYRPGHPVLRGVSLEIPFGESVAVVGPNGCGKTTLINLMLRFYDPVEGAIRFDGIDLRAMRMRDLRERIGLVSQMTQLFDESVASNIRYGSPRATVEEVTSAAVQAHAHRFITEKLPESYETLIGQGGSRLSGGQRQRIALARAILRHPDILILDEATSQIDIESEQQIHQALEEFIAGRTAIMITHRLSTLTLADRVIVMDAGRIVDVGTHWELLERCPVYQRLHEMHFRQSA